MSIPSYQKKKKSHDFIPKSAICLFKEPYSLSTFCRDLQAGVTVGVIALPLAMAFAIASGVSPEKGIFTAIIAGFLISLFGGSRVQIGGPTGAFVVVVYGIIAREGYAGLIAATLLAGALLIVMGLCRMGTLIKYVPHPLITGFTSGIAVIIFSSQVKDFLGLKISQVPADFISKWGILFKALPTADPMTFGVGAGTLATLLLIRRFIPSIPWGVASIAIATGISWAFHFPVETIVSRFGDIPRLLPFPTLPVLPTTFAEWYRLVPDAVTIALLAGIESLLSAVVADGMIGGKHKPNCELIAQGIANLGSCLFGGIPATGAIARTATNIKTGGKTPLAGMTHAAVLFLMILALAPVVGKIPMAALSAVLVMVAWNMSEIAHFRHLLKASLADVTVLLSTFLLTVFVDLTVAVVGGVVIAAFSRLIPAALKRAKQLLIKIYENK
jgi:sulfate permease, SulP family